MAYIVDQLFPPVCDDVEATTDEYSNFNYWRDPVPELSLYDEIDSGLSNEIAAAAAAGIGATSIAGGGTVVGTTSGNSTNESNTIDILSNNIALASMQVASKPLTAIPEN